MPALSIKQLLQAVIQQKASDLHITIGSPPLLRVQGKMLPIKTESLNSDDTKSLCYEIITDRQKKELSENLSIDLSFALDKTSRFRGNIYLQRGSLAAAFRYIPVEIPSIESLKLPNTLKKMMEVPNGLLLVTGPTGSGKTTTLASLLDYINETRQGHIITLEDPIEFIHLHKKCVVNQREIGPDAPSYSSAMRALLRQDPDYVLLGEMRDRESVQMALTIAETGHLLFSTLHTNSAVQTINRLINIFPAHEQNQVRNMLSLTLIGIVSQQLIHTEKGKLALAMEIMRCTPAIRNLIREQKIEMIYSSMQSNQEKTGMQTMNQSLLSLYEQGKISDQTAIEKSSEQEELIRMLSTSSKVGNF